MINRQTHNKLLVALPKAVQPATQCLNNATSSATINAISSLKALAYKVLARNQLCNLSATEQKISCNFEGKNHPKKLHQPINYFNFTLQQLRDRAGDEWADIKINPEALKAFAQALRDEVIIKAGFTPKRWIKNVDCSYCGTVKLWDGCADKVQACPYCLLKTENKQVEVM